MKPTITYPDFDKLDLRVGQVIAANIPEWSEKLLELTVNFGEEIGQKTIFSGVKAWYSPEDFQGKKFIFIVNLAERKMGPAVSQGMMLMGDQDDRPVAVPVPDELRVGSVMV